MREEDTRIWKKRDGYGCGEGETNAAASHLITRVFYRVRSHWYIAHSSVGVHVRVRLVFGRAAERRFRRRRRHRVLLDIYGGQSQISGVRRAPFD